jgi:hypothetical protein
VTYNNEVPTFIRTLVGAGLTIKNVSTKPTFIVVSAERFDEFGIPTNYLFVFCTSGVLSLGDCRTMGKLANENRASLVIAGGAEQIPTSGVLITKEELLAKLGGPVSSLLPLEPNYSSQLVTLSSNQLPAGLVGKPDDLFELYVHSGLQFLLRGRVLRYGQERRFEALPDGVVVNSSAPLMLYDCKAAASGYEITKDSLRQFADYVRDFRSRYEQYLGRAHAFLAVSSSFQETSVSE